MSIVINPNIKTDIEVLIDYFFSGENLLKDLSNKIFNTIFKDQERSYIDYINKAKKFLNSSRKYEYNGLFIIKSSNKELIREEKVALVRYVNICHKNKNFIIILNDEVVYVPKEYIAKYGLEAIEQHIRTTINEFKYKRNFSVRTKRFIKKLIK